MSRAACFPLSQLRTSTSAGRVRLKIIYNNNKWGVTVLIKLIQSLIICIYLLYIIIHIIYIQNMHVDMI